VRHGCTAAHLPNWLHRPLRRFLTVALSQKAVLYAGSIDETAHDLAAIIVTKDSGNRDSWEINLGEGQFILMATVPLFGITIFCELNTNPFRTISKMLA
jgi:hypothetical protein